MKNASREKRFSKVSADPRNISVTIQMTVTLDRDKDWEHVGNGPFTRSVVSTWLLKWIKVWIYLPITGLKVIETKTK